MLIYAAADIHGRPARLEQIASNIALFRPDVLIAAGDLAGLWRPRRVVEALGRLPVPVLAVRGNSDPRAMEGWLARTSGIDSLHLKKIEFGGRSFVGAGGTIPVPFHSRLGFWESRIVKRLAPLLAENSVFAAHPPPWGTLDRVGGRFHAGCRNLTALIKDKTPRVFICGHIHEAAGSFLLDRTLVVNCSMGRGGGGALIELGPDGRSRVEMLAG
ncbi:MAG: metallophosphoesterase [Pseudomonadota bacterium]